jgi:N-methylhydantoinase A/oxoprolinase/acetone carboxylase beta subunit
MAVFLGIDTGGTYTDAAIFDTSAGVKASAKALTTKHELSIGIGRAVSQVVKDHADEIDMVSISTTLATNALTEGHGSSVCLILAGYTEEHLAQVGLRSAVGADPIVLVAGGHTSSGSELEPLDERAVRGAIAEHRDRVSAFAVSTYFSVRNPSHELAIVEMVRSMTGLPVTSGHELTSNLHAARRALTVAFNARLIPLIQQLIVSVRAILESHGIRAPLMVVKGDGSLISADMALHYPVETILSGPAASLVGAQFLAGRQDALVMDMGGTTTDAALLLDGRPRLSPEGAQVGEWQTMVEAASIHTFGLGGDSEVRRTTVGRLMLGPRRVIPLSLLGHEQVGAVELLSRQLSEEPLPAYDGRVVLQLREHEAISELTSYQRSVLDGVAGGPVPLRSFFENGAPEFLMRRDVYRLVDRGVIGLAGFTPTDAAHVLGLHTAWSRPAAELGARLWLRSDGQRDSDEAVEDLAKRVREQAVFQSCQAAVATALAESHGVRLADHRALQEALIDPALGAEASDVSMMQATLSLRTPIIAIGAPVRSYYPDVARRLATELVVPQHAEIANAVGAVAGGITQRVHVLIRPYADVDGYRIHMPDGVRDEESLTTALAVAEAAARDHAAGLAKEAGAETVQVELQREDLVPETSADVVEVRVTAVATGRPHVGHL